MSRGIAVKSGNDYRKISLDKIELLALNDLLLTQREMAERLGVSMATVERALRTFGIKSKRGHGSPLERNHFWNGGRPIDKDGYVLVKVSRHPFATKAGYVREHRLVMESVLG